MDSAWIGAVAASIAVPIAFAVLRRYFPVPRGAEPNRSLADLRREYGKWELLTLPLLFTIVPAASYVWWKIFLLCASDVGFSQHGAVYTLRPPRIAWLIPAMLLGILSAGPPTDLIFRRLLGTRYREYVAYQNLRHGFDSEAIVKPFYFGSGALAAVGVFMIADWYAVFAPTEIRLNPFLGIRERAFEYSDLIAIKTAPAFIAPNGKTVARREYVLLFSDATSWSSNFDPSEATGEQILSLVKATSQRSGVPITEVSVLEREDFE